MLQLTKIFFTAIINSVELWADGFVTLSPFLPEAWILKYITAVIYGFSNKLECFSLNIRLDWKGLPGTYALAYYGNRKLRP